MVKFIADIGSNHNSSLERALELIQEAKLVGCSAVKFQLFNQEINKPQREWLPLEWLPELRDEAHNLGLQFGCTPFYLKAVEELKPYVDFYKLTSNYGLREKMLRKISSLTTYKDYIITTTGIAIYASYPPSMFYESGTWIHRPRSNYSVQFSLLAVPQYPTKLENAQLKRLRNLDGWSDHTRNAGVIYRAVHRYDAKVIEFHLDLDGKGWEYKHGHCWLPAEIAEVIRNVKEGFEAD